MSNSIQVAADLNSTVIQQKLMDRMTDFLSREQVTKEISFAVQIIAKNKQLKQASANSTLQAILNVSQIGLTLNPVMKLAYLVPRYDRAMRGMTVALEPSYQGLVKLLTDTGSVKSVYCQLVHQDDVFRVSIGTNVSVTHELTFKSKEVTHAYAVAELHDGIKHVEVMTIDEINDIRDTSESWKAMQAGKISSCVWFDHAGEMARKTVIRRLVKYLPKSERWDQLSQAVSLDESDWQISDNQFHYVEGLISTSTFEEHVKQDMEMQLSVCSRSEFDQIVQKLLDNQIDPISSGRNYSQTDIKNKMSQEI